MRKKNTRVNKPKLYAAIATFAIVGTLGYGVYSVAMDTNKNNMNNNIVNLDEQDNVAMKIEDADKNSLQSEDDSQNMAEASNKNAQAMQFNENKENSEDQKLTEQQNADRAAEKLINNDSQTIEDENNKGNSKTDNKSVVNNAAYEYSFSEADTIAWPVKGDIILKYSMDTTIYYKTLGLYKTNPAISISAQEGTNVGAAADGVVTKVEKSEELGNVLSIAIGDGYELTYGLIDGVAAKPGDKVVKGQMLGTVSAPTAYYEKEGANLYFEMTKDGEPIDPAAYFED